MRKDKSRFVKLVHGFDQALILEQLGELDRLD
jgi:hypothetical protein